ncbi:MAG TPA: NAD(P)/FAD-dependent oxidoreductase [Terriglobales bacterium]|nr:NAD(P)/FAD-dependent oxidoreductase [Terriglobales bacterium]
MASAGLGTGRSARSQPAIVVGSGPNGLTAAIILAHGGRRVTVFEAEQNIGGGSRSAELTLPGFVHDVCSSIHPLGVGSPVFRTFPLEQFGLEWVQPAIPLAHPLDDGTAAVLAGSVEETAERLGEDGAAYRRLVGPGVQEWDEISALVLAPSFPRHPWRLTRLGWNALQPVTRLARSRFRSEPARALFAGLGAHAMLPLEHMGTSAIALALAVAGHSVGWAFPRGGSQKIANALAAYAQSLGVEIRTGTRVTSLKELPRGAEVLCDVTPRQLLQIGGEDLPPALHRRLKRYRYGMAAYKVDWALGGPIPWRAEDCRRAGTVHLGGTLDEIAAGERATWSGAVLERPFVLLAQHTLFDPTRAPAGQHTAWAYCHVPNGSKEEMLARIEAQIERFAPGFRNLILARSVMPPAELEAHNANLIGGDISGGSMEFRQMFMRMTARPSIRSPWRVYLCSSSTFPAPGVHGMCGYFAAKACLRGR